jgi:hypothetical protein
MAGCGRGRPGQGAPKQGAKAAGGYWLTTLSEELAEVSVKPCGDSQHVWAYTDEGLYRVDVTGKVDRVGGALAPEKTLIRDVYPVPKAGPKGEEPQAWVTATQERRLFFVTGTNAVAFKGLPEDAKVDTVSLAGAQAWVEVTVKDKRRLYRVNKSPPTQALVLARHRQGKQLELVKPTDTEPGRGSHDQVEINNDGRRSRNGKWAWGSLVGGGAYAVSAEGPAEEHDLPMGSGPQFFPIRDGEQAWAQLPNSGALHLLRVGRSAPEPQETRSEKMWAADDEEGRYVWSSGASGELQLLEAGQPPISYSGLPPAQEIKAVYPDAKGKLAWVVLVGDNRLFFVRTDDPHRVACQCLPGAQGIPDISYVTPFGDGNRARVVPSSAKRGLYVASADSKRADWYKGAEVEKQYVEEVFTAGAPPEHFWAMGPVKATLAKLPETGTPGVPAKDLALVHAFRLEKPEKVYASTDGGRGWLSTHQGPLYVYRAHGEVNENLAKAQFRDGSMLDFLSNEPPKELPLDCVVVQVQTELGSRAVKPKLRFDVSKGDEVAVSGLTAELDGEKRLDYRLIGDSKDVRPNDLCRVWLTFTDDLGGEVRLVQDVRFIAPGRNWLEGPRANACYLFVGLLVLAAVLLWLPGPRSGVSKWALACCWLLGGVGGGAGWFVSKVTSSLDAPVDWGLLVFLLGAALLAGVSVGCWSPAFFREVSRTAPFNWLAPLALLVPRLRRRLFRDYCQAVRARVDNDRRAANRETYIQAPVALTPPGGKAMTARTQEPPDRVLAWLTADDLGDRCHVLIESPGGRGKTVLLREVVLRALDQFEQGGSGPLPVLCPAVGGKRSEGRVEKWLERLVSEGLGAGALPEEVLRQLLKAGQFFAVIDGLSESDIEADWLEQFVLSEYGKKVRLLLSSRPNLAYRHALQASDELVLVEPQLLEEPVFAEFEATYRKVDRTEGSLLNPELKKACRAQDGKSYLPILVRLALQVSDEGVNSVADIYEATFCRLLRKGGDNGPAGPEGDEYRKLLREAAELSLAGYWQDAQPTLRYREAEAQKGLLERLYAAGVLVAADDAPSKVSKEPRRVRFFHDLMQSYLTARGLVNRGGWEKELARAAGDPAFASRGPELFQMCLAILEGEARLRGALVADLRKWAQNDGNLTRNSILRATPTALQKALDERMSTLPDSPSAGAVLGLAVDVCNEAANDKEAVQWLGTLYPAIARLAWIPTGGSST